VAAQERVLVIDDEESVRDAFVDALEGMPLVVMTACGGPEALERVRSGPVALVFLDLKMPGMDGVEVLRKIREADEAVPVYIVTAFYAEFLSRLQAAEDEGLAFRLLCKPVGPKAIRKVTATALGCPGPEGGKAQ
jgi:CheY-like chemotaxis protein